MENLRNVFAMGRWMQGWRKIHGGFLVAALFSLCFVSQASDTGAGNGCYTLTSETSGKCLDTYDGQTTVCAKLRQWDCHGGAKQMLLAELTEHGIRFKPAYGGLCVVAQTAKSESGVLIQQSVCRAGLKGQIWIPDPRILSWTGKAKFPTPFQPQRLKYPAIVGTLTRF